MEKTQEAYFGHVKLEMPSTRPEEYIWRSSLPLSSTSSSGHLLLANQNYLKFDTSELNSFPSPQTVSTTSAADNATQSGPSQSPSSPHYQPQCTANQSLPSHPTVLSLSLSHLLWVLVLIFQSLVYKSHLTNLASTHNSD